MKTATWAQIRSNAPRLIAASIAIILSVGFVVGTLALSAAFNKTVSSAVAAPLEHASVQVDPDSAQGEGHKVDRTVKTVRGAAHVKAADAVKTSGLGARINGNRTFAEITALPDKSVRWQTLAGGSWPSGPTQITLDQSSAKNFHVKVGDTFTVMKTTIDTKKQSVREVPKKVTVSGITKTSGSVLSAGMVTATMTDAGQARLDNDPIADTILVASDGAPDGDVAASVTHALKNAGLDASVQTHDEAVNAAVEQVSGNGNLLTMVVLVFATISLFVAAIVIANTFQVLVAQRTRELALLRCVGASTSQVRRSVYAEAFATGLIASIIGVLAGYGLAAGVAALSQTGSAGIQLGAPTANAGHITIGIVAGVAVTMAAAVLPARRATRVLPIAALRPVESAHASSRAGVVRLVIAAVLIAGGSALLIAGALGVGLMAGLTGGVICFVGVLLASSLLVPLAVRGVGSLVGFTGVPGRLAAANAVRNPGRTATTAAALLIGVTLVSTVMVGATSVRGSLENEVDAKRPIDLVVSSTAKDGLTKAQTASVQDAKHVEHSIVLHGASEKAGKASVDVLGVPTDQIGSVVHAGTLTPGNSQVVMNADTARGLDVAAGESLPLGASGHRFTVKVESQAPDGSALVTASRLKAMDSDAPAAQVWLKIDPSLTASEIQDMSSSITSDIPSANVSGGAAERAAYGQIINTMMLVVIGLLAIAVVIALVGVGNTLALSVLERRRESALLRALGLTKGQLRGMLGVESVLVAAVAALMGIGFGVFYGWAGTGAITTGSDLPTALVIPWGQFGLVLAVAVAAGLVASILPARRATKLSPVEGMSME